MISAKKMGLMRKIYAFVLAVFSTAILVAFTSCAGKMETSTDFAQLDDTVSVTLNALSFDFVTSPMTKSVTEPGLYGVQIVPYGPEYINNEVHACWLTENIAEQSFKLKKGTTYFIQVVFVPNGKEVLESNDGVYGPPFMNGSGANYTSPVLGHDIYYGGAANIKSAGNGTAQKKGHSSWYVQSNLLSDVDIYHGGTKITAQNDITLDINLYRCMFGLQIEVSNLKEGKIHIYESDYTNETYAAVLRNNGIVYTLTPQESSMDKALELVSMPFSHATDETIINYESPLVINIDYEYPDGSVITLFNKRAWVKRMVKYSFSFDLDEVLETVSGRTDATIQDEDWQNSSLDDATISY